MSDEEWAQMQKMLNPDDGARLVTEVEDYLTAVACEPQYAQLRWSAAQQVRNA